MTEERVDFNNVTHDDVELALLLKAIKSSDQRQAVIDHKLRLRPGQIWDFFEAKNFSASSTKRTQTTKLV